MRGSTGVRKRSAGIPTTLRRRAEATAGRLGANLDGLSRSEIDRLVHELQVHQIELEMQNEELRETQLALAQSRDRLNDLYDFAPVGYLTLDSEGRIREANLTAAGMLGVERRALSGRKFTSFISRQSQDVFLVHCRDVFGNERSAGCEISLRTSGDSGRIVRLESVHVTDPRSETPQCRSALLDETERRNSLEALRRAEAHLRLALSGAEMGAWEWDRASDSASWNEKMFELFGVPVQLNPVPSELLFHKVHPDDLPALRLGIEQASTGGLPLNVEFRVVRAGGQVHWLRGVGRVISEGAHKRSRVFGVFYDVSHRKRMEAELSELNSELKRRVAQRTTLSEVRANQIRILAGELTKVEQRERDRIAGLIHDHIQQLLVAARMRLSLLKTELPDRKQAVVVRDAADLVKEAIEASRSLSVELGSPAELEEGLGPSLEWLADTMHRIHGLHVGLCLDPAADPLDKPIRLICFNIARELLLNVVKHSGVTEVSVAMEDAGNGRTRLIVEDHGVGFDVQARTRRGRASGFGLASIRHKLRLFGGQLQIRSMPGAGTTVGLVIPREHVHASGNAPPPLPIRVASDPPQPRSAGTGLGASSAPRFRLLLADDHQTMRQALAAAFSREPDFEVVGEADDGRAAVSMARKLRPDVVIMDVSMPRLDGIEATRRIVGRVPGVRIVALSMHDESRKHRAMIAAGAVAYVTKSAPVQDLMRAVRSAVSPPPDGGSQGEPRPRTRGRR